MPLSNLFYIRPAKNSIREFIKVAPLAEISYALDSHGNDRFFIKSERGNRENYYKRKFVGLFGCPGEESAFGGYGGCLVGVYDRFCLTHYNGSIYQRRGASAFPNSHKFWYSTTAFFTHKNGRFGREIICFSSSPDVQYLLDLHALR